MTLKWKLFGFLIAATALVTALIMGPLSEPSPKAKFTGWTNIAGINHAMAEVAPVPVVKYKNFFCFQYYQVNVDYIYVDAAGQTNNGSYDARDFHGVTTNRLVVMAPIPTNAVSFQFVKLTPAIRRGWDNVHPPFRAPQRYFKVKTPMILPDDMARLPR